MAAVISFSIVPPMNWLGGMLEATCNLAATC
jgi:hypothetical protein